MRRHELSRRSGLPLLAAVLCLTALLAPARSVDAVAIEAERSGWNPAPVPRGLYARSSVSMAFDGDGLMMFGGCCFEGAARPFFAETWLRRHGTWRRADTPVAPSGRQQAATAFDAARGEVVIFGGNAIVDGTGTFVDETWTWNGSEWRRESPRRSPPARTGAALAYDAVRREVVLFGGFDAGGLLGDTWTWNGASWRRARPPVSPPPRIRHAMTFDEARGEVVLFGGCCADGEFGDTWTWDGETWARHSPGSSPAPRRSHAMAYDPLRGEVVLFGGFENDTPQNFGDTWTWDGSGWTRESPSTTPHPRSGPGLAYDPDARGVVMFGGGDFLGADAFSGTWTWDGATWTRDPSPIRPRPPGVAFQGAMASHPPTRSVVLFGPECGVDECLASTVCDAEDPCGSTWTWDGWAWKEHRPSVSPGARIWTAMSYHGGTRRVVLFGGCPGTACASPSADTWTWDGAGWTEHRPGPAPSSRFGHAMAYDAARDEVLLFGDRANAAAETWTWDGQGWNLEPAEVAPSGRAYSAMAYDAARRQVVLFGGRSASGSTLGDTWVWDGTVWRRIRVRPSPPPRLGGSMAFDAARRRVVLFGGARDVNGAVMLDDTWSWDGSGWRLERTPEGLGPRWFPAMARRGGTIVLFGGQLGNPGLVVDDTWEWRTPLG